MQWQPDWWTRRCARPTRQQSAHASRAGGARDRRRACRCVARAVGASFVVQSLSACATPAGGWFQLGPHPAALAGVWVDASHAAPTDTVAWVLTPKGEDRALVVHVYSATTGRPAAVTRRETRHGFWYLSGVLGDTARQAICEKRRARDGASCTRFRLDTLPATADAPGRWRLRLLGVRGAQPTRERVLVERW